MRLLQFLKLSHFGPKFFLKNFRPKFLLIKILKFFVIASTSMDQRQFPIKQNIIFLEGRCVSGFDCGEGRGREVVIRIGSLGEGFPLFPLKIWEKKTNERTLHKMSFWFSSSSFPPTHYRSLCVFSELIVVWNFLSDRTFLCSMVGFYYA